MTDSSLCHDILNHNTHQKNLRPQQSIILERQIDWIQSNDKKQLWWSVDGEAACSLQFAHSTC
jgi:hypothetical protein